MRRPEALAQNVLRDGVLQPVWEREGRPLSIGRSHLIVPDRTRRIVERRDRGCRVPGCTAGRFAEIHSSTVDLAGDTIEPNRPTPEPPEPGSEWSWWFAVVDRWKRHQRMNGRRIGGDLESGTPRLARCTSTMVTGRSARLMCRF